MIATKASPKIDNTKDVEKAKAALAAAADTSYKEVSATETDSQDMALAASAIFSGATNGFKTSAGKPAVIRQATMKQIPVILRFFQAIVGGLDQTALISLVELYADRQRKALAAGVDPNAIEMGPEEDSEAMVGKVFGNVSLLTQLLASASEVLPELVVSFTNLTEDEYENLPPDEGLTLVGGVFMLNYGFFSRALPPIFQGLMQAMAARKGVEKPATKSPILRRR